MRKLVRLFPRVMRGLRRHAEEHIELMRESGLGPRHATTLHALLEAPRTVGELAVQLRLTLATVSGVVADLDRAGLVARTQDPADRRRTVVTVRAERRSDAEAWVEASTSPLARTLEQLTPGERASFVKAMDILQQRLEEDPTGSGDDRRGRQQA